MNRSIIYLVSFLLLLMPAPVVGKTSPELQRLIQESKARADIVEATQNAVVHIHVEKTIRSNAGGQHYNNPFDQFIVKLNGKTIKNADQLKNEVGLTTPDTK